MSLQVNSARLLQKLLRRFSTTGPHPLEQSVDSKKEDSKAPQPIRTASNVIRPINLKEDTMNDLYGLNGTVGIAEWKRFSLLNNFLHGFRLGELTILTGPTGSGKTTFLSEYSLDLIEQGVNTLWCNFELKNSRLCAMMMRQLYSTPGSPFDPATTPEETMSKLIDKMDQLPLYYTTFAGATRVDHVMGAILSQHEIQPLHHVIIDNLQFMLGSARFNEGANPFLMQDNVFSRFRQLATMKNIHVTMVIHPRKFAQADVHEELSVHSLYGGGKASQEADNILLIQVRRKEQEYYNKYLQIAKNRYFGDVYNGDRMELSFNKKSCRHTLKMRSMDTEIYKKNVKYDKK